MKFEISRLGHAEALAVRLLLCHKELLAEPAVERVLSGLLCTAGSAWRTQLAVLVVNTLSADLHAVTDSVASNSVPGVGGAAGGRGRSSSRLSAATRDAAVIDSLLRDLRPFVIAARVPALLRVAIGTDADRDCLVAVRQALESAGVNRSNAETEQRCEEVEQLLAAIEASARPLREA